MAKVGNWAYALGVAILMISSGLLGYWLAPGESDGSTLDPYYQVSTYGRLSDGHYEGIVTLDRLLVHGDFGIGTVEGIDGEMIILDGTAYRAGTDLVPEEISLGTMIPFAMVAHFSTGVSYGLTDIDGYDELRERYGGMADRMAPCIAIAVMIEAEFDSITIRSVPGQQVPYPPLSDVVANQTTMVLSGVRGTMVGFIMADGLGEINLAGFHMHFMSEDLSYGGHVLEVSFDEGRMYVDEMTSMTLVQL